jgi:two-component system NarL family sensor kinase
MSTQSDLIQNLTTLNQIAQTLNQAVDVRGALNSALAQLVELMELETGWIFLIDATAQERWGGKGYVLVAHHNLPPALALDNTHLWTDGCECQDLCDKGRLSQAYNEVHCSRLASASGDRHGLTVMDAINAFTGDTPQSDDFTLLVVKRNPLQDPPSSVVPADVRSVPS